MAEVIILGCAYSNPNHNACSRRGAVYSRNGILGTVVMMVGGGNHPMIICKINNEKRNTDSRKIWKCV